MNYIKQYKINKLNVKNANNIINSPHIINSTNWLDIRESSNELELIQQYADICQQHNISNKWILMINPENNSLEQLTSKYQINTSKILRVDTNKVKISINNIQTALSKGNCSAVILCNASLKQYELSQLTECAKQGKTQCIILKKNITVH